MPALALVYCFEAVPAAGVGDANLFVFGLAFEWRGTALAGEGGELGVSLLCPHRWVFPDDGFGVSP